MVIGFTKQMHTHIVGQPQRKSIGQQKRVDSFIYSFITNIKRTDMDWDGLYDAIVECLTESMKLDLDIPSGQYAVRFTATGDKADLTADAYAAEVRWSVQHLGGDFSESGLKDYPWKYINDSSVQIEVDAAALTLEEVEALTADDIED